MTVRSLEAIQTQIPAIYLKEITDNSTSDRLAAALVEELAREHPEQEMDYPTLKGLIDEKLNRLGYNPNPFERHYSGLTFNFETRIAKTAHGTLEKPLSPTQSIILKTLIESPGKPIPHENLLDLIGTGGFYGSSERKLLKTTVSQLRKALLPIDGKNCPNIIARRHVGYVLI